MSDNGVSTRGDYEKLRNRAPAFRHVGNIFHMLRGTPEIEETYIFSSNDSINEKPAANPQRVLRRIAWISSSGGHKRTATHVDTGLNFTHGVSTILKKMARSFFAVMGLVLAHACDMLPTGLRTNNLVDPLGIDITATKLSWALTATSPHAAKNQLQSAYDSNCIETPQKKKLVDNYCNTTMRKLT